MLNVKNTFCVMTIGQAKSNTNYTPKSLWKLRHVVKN